MSEPFGSFVTDDGGSNADGKSAALPNLKPIDGASGPIGGPENILYGFDAIEPETIALDSVTGARAGSGSGDSGEPRKRRGRKPGSTNAPKEEKSSSLIDLTEILLNIHVTAATLLHISELELEKDEAKKLSDAIKEVTKFYPVALDPKKVAIANLLITAGGIYGTRILAYRLTHPKGPKAVKQAEPVQFPGPVKQTVNAPPAKLEKMNSPNDLWPMAPVDNPTF